VDVGADKLAVLFVLELNFFLAVWEFPAQNLTLKLDRFVLQKQNIIKLSSLSIFR
jgi:hypothetical protein